MHLLQPSLHTRRIIKVSSSRNLNLHRWLTVFSDADPINDEGFLLDIDVVGLSSNKIKPKHDRKGQDVDKFFSPKYSEIGVDSKPHVYHYCTLCSKKGPHKCFMKDLSTCHRHLRKDHKVRSVFVSLNAHNTN
jgi:hypothetical protein